MTSLFDPVTVGAIDAPNRIIMAPLTRGRGTRSHAQTRSWRCAPHVPEAPSGPQHDSSIRPFAGRSRER
jgi:2,4-dienoyl-CoA reductase-like NADH-dependent reductase (Old Yellow Enzyme family)